MVILSQNSIFFYLAKSLTARSPVTYFIAVRTTFNPKQEVFSGSIFLPNEPTFMSKTHAESFVVMHLAACGGNSLDAGVIYLKQGSSKERPISSLHINSLVNCLWNEG